MFWNLTFNWFFLFELMKSNGSLNHKLSVCECKQTKRHLCGTLPRTGVSSSTRLESWESARGEDNVEYKQRTSCQVGLNRRVQRVKVQIKMWFSPPLTVQWCAFSIEAKNISSKALGLVTDYSRYYKTVGWNKQPVQG